MNLFKTTIGIISILFLLTNCQTKTDNKMSILDTTIKQHFDAIKNRDIDKLIETVDTEKITLILPNGKYSESLADYKDINIDWFSDKNWGIKYDIVSKIIRKETAIVLTRITYYDKDKNDKDYSFEYFLTLIFNLNGNEWKLVFDQNTIIR